MAIYTGVADSNGDFNIPFATNYTGGQKITVTAEKDAATKTIEIFAPSRYTPVGDAIIQFSGDGTSFPNNIGDVTISNITGAIGAYAFFSSNANDIWRKATGLTMEDGITAIGDRCFQGWQNSKFIVIPSSLQTIGDNAFMSWASALSLIIPSTVISIGQYAFSTWSSAITLEVNALVASIGTQTFNGWSSLKTVVLSEAITSIGGSAMAGWVACEQITILANTPPTIAATTFSNLNPACIFKVPASSVAAYRAATNWSAFADRIQAI